MYASPPTGIVFTDSLGLLPEVFVKLVHVVIAVSLSVATAVAGIYAVAATTAKTMVASFSTSQATSRTQIADFSSRVKQAAAAHRAARASCKLLAGPQRQACNAEMRAQDARAFGARQP